LGFGAQRKLRIGSLPASRFHDGGMVAANPHGHFKGKVPNFNCLTDFAFAAGVANARDEFTKRQGFLPALGFHG
jgi:hypothetical protein